MARYIGPKLKLIKRECSDLFLKSGLVSLDFKSDINKLPGHHCIRKFRISDYGSQLREKQKVKRIYGIFENQFRNYFKKARSIKGNTGIILLQLLECRLDNIIYRMGFALTRSEARQLVTHKFVDVNNITVNIPSFQVKPGDIIEINSKGKNKLRIKFALNFFKSKEILSWINVDSLLMKGIFLCIPDRNNINIDINENLIVELYSK